MLNNYRFILVSILICFIAVSVNAATYTVTKTADTNDGVCNADCSLREAIAAANSTVDNDIINFDSAAFANLQTITLGGTELFVANNGSLTINGTAPNRLKISGNNLSRVFSISSNATATMNSLTVTGGSVNATNGGGINNAGTLTLNKVEIIGNTATFANDQGGGIYNNSQATLNLNNSSVINNWAGNLGGGIYNNSVINITNSTISGNSATQGGAIYNTGGLSSAITNSTIVNNSATFVGGIINFATLNSSNSIYAGNTATVINLDINGVITSQGYNLIEKPFNTIGGDETGNILNVSPQLAPLGFYGGETMTHALLSNSPALNAGNTATSPTTDQRGAARIGTADIGAFELNNTATGGNFAATLPRGRVGIGYGFTLVSEAGTTVYCVSSGSLPPGMTGLANCPAPLAESKDTQELAPTAAIVLGGTPTQDGVFNFTVTATNGGNSNVTNYSVNIFVPTAAGVSVAGRVFTNDGRGLTNATVTITDQNGNSRSTRTGSFGYFRFDDVRSGETYIISVSSRRYQYASQVVNVSESLEGLNFIAR